MTEGTQHKALNTDQETRPDWLPESEYPFELRSIDVDGKTVVYIDEGEGPALLFVHSGLWSFVFRDVIVRLRENFRCLTLDFPGVGLSPGDEGAAPLIEESSVVLERFIDALGLSEITLVVHDLGGPVALGMAARRPELIKGLVLSSTFAWNPEGLGMRGMLRTMASAPMRGLNRATNFMARVTVTRFGLGRNLTRGGKKAFLGPYRERARRRQFHTLSGNALEIEPYLAGIEQALQSTLRNRPVLTIFGPMDPFGFQDRYREIFPTIRTVEIPKGFHFPMMDDPHLFAEAVKEWWDEVVTA